MTCAECGAPATSETAKFCSECGAGLRPAACAECGAALSPGAKFCAECGSAQAAVAPASASHPGRQPVAARRVTSVLFGDLVGFTSLSEARDQEEVRELLSDYFDRCRRVVERYGGTVEKFIGDAVMAVWGVPAAYEDDAERAVRAGLELVAAVATLGEEIGFEGLAMRVGIVTGEVAVTIGAESEGMVAGDAVNTAARVQSAAAPGQVWVDETTRLLTSAAITYVDVGSHALKGKAEPIPLWSVRAVVAAVGGAQRADGLEAPLVGRDRDLRLVKELFHAVDESRRPALLLLVGDAGVGKSRLTWELEKYIDGLTRSVRWHSGRCVAYGEGVAYYALAEALRGRLQTLQGADAETGADDDTAALLEAGLARYVPDEDERTWLRPRLAALVGAGSAATFPREDLFAAWATFLEWVGEGNPVALVIDDAQHADDGLLLFVEHLLAAATFPCFVVMITRPGLIEENPRLATNRRASVIHLEALSDPDIGTLLDGLVAGLPATVRDSLVARSEGVPLFAVETVRSLIDRDLVVPRGGQYVLADPDALDLDAIGAPVTLQALIAARLDTLAPTQRRLVDLASVLGMVFTRDQLAHLAEDAGVDADLDADLADLVRLQIVSVDANRFSASHGDFQFLQQAVRQVAYATLSRRDRKATHLAVAEHLERDDEGGGDQPAIVAQHYLDAAGSLPGEPDVPDLENRAIGHLERAADRARALGAMTEAAGHLRGAMELARDGATRARIGSQLAWALVDGGQYDEGAELAAASVETSDAAGDAVSAGMAAAAQARALVMLGDSGQGIAVAEPRWLALAGVAGAEHAHLLLARALWAGYSRQGDPRVDICQQAIQLAETLRDWDQLASWLGNLSGAFSVKGASHTASVLMQAAADIGRTRHLPASLALTLTNLTVLEMHENLPRALETGRESVEVAERAGVAAGREYARYNLALSLLEAGEWDELEALLDDGENGASFGGVLTAAAGALARQVRGLPHEEWRPGEEPATDDASLRGWRECVIGLHLGATGDRTGGLTSLIASVHSMVEVGGISDDLLHAWPVAADLALELGDRAALDELLGVVDDQAGHGYVPLAIQGHRQRIRGLAAREADPDAAEALLREALGIFDEWGARLWHARVETELGDWLVACGRPDDGQELAERGRATLATLGAHGWLARHPAAI